MGGGRPAKMGCDWFPHFGNASDASKTVTILENHFGAEGYATWFKLLERLTTANNHIIDCRNAEETEFLAAKLHLPPERLEIILNKLVELGAIDQTLWGKRTIWCQNLVDNLKPVYDNRRQELPHKPLISTTDKPITTIETPISSPESTAREEGSRGSRESRENPPDPLPIHPALRKDRNGDRPLFDKLLSIYPKKADAVEAMIVFYTMLDDGTLSEQLLDDVVLPAIERLKQTASWKERNGHFIPRLDKFLDRKQWMEAPQPSPSAEDSTSHYKNAQVYRDELEEERRQLNARFKAEK